MSVKTHIQKYLRKIVHFSYILQIFFIYMLCTKVNHYCWTNYGVLKKQNIVRKDLRKTDNWISQ